MPLLRLALLALPLLALGPIPAHAQVETFRLGPGSRVSPESRVEPRDCVTDPKTGAITCRTTVETPPGSTPARPELQPFRN
ncbi:MAG: hypothetical protein VKO00_00755 [Cyanobacteriota bacterium]|jgi:hypothetical protein|nr:hypothetical protein [Cyanobacteriota bacterium]